MHEWGSSGRVGGEREEESRERRWANHDWWAPPASGLYWLFSIIIGETFLKNCSAGGWSTQ
jgi:hypothetical protein